MKIYHYRDTEIYHHWQRLAIPENHRCISCERKLRPENHVTVESYLQENDGGAMCVPCSNKEGEM